MDLPAYHDAIDKAEILHHDISLSNVLYTLAHNRNLNDLLCLLPKASESLYEVLQRNIKTCDPCCDLLADWDYAVHMPNYSYFSTPTPDSQPASSPLAGRQELITDNHSQTITHRHHLYLRRIYLMSKMIMKSLLSNLEEETSKDECLGVTYEAWIILSFPWLKTLCQLTSLVLLTHFTRLYVFL